MLFIVVENEFHSDEMCKDTVASWLKDNLHSLAFFHLSMKDLSFVCRDATWNFFFYSLRLKTRLECVSLNRHRVETLFNQIYQEKNRMRTNMWKICSLLFDRLFEDRYRNHNDYSKRFQSKHIIDHSITTWLSRGWHTRCVHFILGHRLPDNDSNFLYFY